MVMLQKVRRALIPAFLLVFARGQLLSAAVDPLPVDLEALRNPRAHAPIHPLIVPGVSPEAAPLKNTFHPRDRPALHDSELYDLHLQVQAADATLVGNLTYTFTSQHPELRTVSLDAYDMSIKAVTASDGSPLPYTYDGQLLAVTLSKPLALAQKASIQIAYAAQRSDSFFATGPDASNPQRLPAAYTFTQPEGSQTWFPCVDSPADKAMLDITVDVDEPHKVLSNGHLLAETSLPDGKRYRYRMDAPIAPYLVSLAIGPYEILALGEFKGKPLSLWTPPAIRQAAWRETADTSAMMSIISDFTGVDYPFASYATSVAPAWTTSMEHQTATTMGGWRISGDGSGEGVVAHELAHQWFGDWVTCERWSELWLNEGFASYLPAIYFKARGKRHDLLAYEDYWRSGYLREAATKVRPLSSPSTDWQDLFDSHAYEKGALVLKLMHNIADRMPAADATTGNFTLALRHYLQTHSGSNVRNQDLQASLEQATGRSWQVFFDQWVRSSGHPILQVDWQAQGQELVINLEQEQALRSGQRRWTSFSFPLDIEVLGAAGERQVVTADIYGPDQQLRFTLPFEAQAINLDPEWQVPFEWKLGNASANFLAIWRASPSERSRIYAMRQILKKTKPAASDDVAALIAGDSSLYLQADAIARLTANPDNRSRVAALVRQLEAQKARNDYDRIVLDAVALIHAWLVRTSPTAPSAADEEAWQAGYLTAATVTQRSALLDQLKTASLPRARQFALQRLKESKWVTRDRAALIDLLTASAPSRESWEFIEPSLKKLTYLWFNRVLGNLTDQGLDDPRLVDPLLEQAASYRYTGGRVAAINLLAKQQTSRGRVCPTLAELRVAPVRQPDTHTRVRYAAGKAYQQLDCAKILPRGANEDAFYRE